MLQHLGSCICWSSRTLKVLEMLAGTVIRLLLCLLVIRLEQELQQGMMCSLVAAVLQQQWVLGAGTVAAAGLLRYLSLQCYQHCQLWAQQQVLGRHWCLVVRMWPLHQQHSQQLQH
jgi:hypothetical protein